MLRRCSRVLPYSYDAEDACQEALIAVAKGIHDFEVSSRFTTWLHPVVMRSAFATYRRVRDAAQRSVAAEHAPEPMDPTRVSVLVDARVDVVEALERLRVDRPLLAEAVVLRDLAGLDYDEIAQHVDVPLGTVKSRISHGRLALRELLTDAHLPG